MPTMTGRVPDRSVFFRLRLSEKRMERRLLRSLERVEDRLAQCADQVCDPRIADIVGHLTTVGGKRIRPLLTLLAAEFGDPSAPGVIDAAVVCELVHTASLCHDDVMDQATLRHGAASANVRWGNRTAVRAGDWLLARAAQYSVALDTSATRLQAAASERLVRGQVRELTGPAAQEDRLAHYFAVVSDKSAALIAFALRMGALQAGALEPVCAALAEYGEHLGVAFQISDDLIDITSSASVLGKERGKDLANGVLSLPVLLTLADTDPRNAALRALLEKPVEAAEGAHGRALSLLRDAPAMAEARAMMTERLDRARSLLDALPPGPARAALHELCAFVAARDA